MTISANYLAPCLLLLSLLHSMPAAAADLDNLQALDQAEFGSLAEDLTAVGGYKSVEPTEPYGLIGYDISAGASAVRLSYKNVWQQAGANVSTLSFARVSVTKGLPLGFDVGGHIASVPETGMQVYGAQLRYALHEGGVLTPAVGLRASVTRLSGVDKLDLATRALDLSMSKAFGPFTPYAGIGRVWSDATPDASLDLDEENVALTRTYGGVRFSAVVLQLTFEAEQIGETMGYSAGLGFMF